MKVECLRNLIVVLKNMCIRKEKLIMETGKRCKFAFSF